MSASRPDALALSELNELLWALPISLDSGEIAAALLERGARMFRSPLAGLWVTVDGHAELVGAFGLTDKKAEQLWAGLGLEGMAAEQLHLFGEGLQAAGAGAFGKRRLGALLATPLRLPTGLLGWLVFARLDVEGYSEFEEQLVGIISNRVAIALDNARLYRHTAQSARELAVMNDLSALLVSTVRLEDLLEAIVARVTEAFGLSLCTIQLLDPESGTLPPTAAYHRDPVVREGLHAMLAQTPMRADRSLTGRLFESRRATLIPNVADAPEIMPQIREMLGAGSLLALPLLVRGQPIGAMYWFKAGCSQPLDEARLPLARQLALQIAMAVENARLYQALERRVNDRDRNVDSAYEALAAHMIEGRGFVSQMVRDLRSDLASLSDPAAYMDRDDALARMRTRLDGLEAHLAAGPHPGEAEGLAG